MPRRRRSKQPDTSRDQPSRAPLQPVLAGDAAEGSVPASLPSSVMTPSLTLDAPSGSSDLQPATTSSAAPSAVSAKSSELQMHLMLNQPAPSSSKAVRFADRPNYGQVGKNIQVRANHFLVQVADRDLHHYDVSITPEVSSKLINRNVMNKLCELYKESHLGKRTPAYDGRKSLFTAGPLPFSSKQFVVKLVDTDEPASSSSSTLALPRKEREREYKVSIRYASKADLHHLQQFLRRLQLDNPQETIQALDIVLRTSPSEKYTVVGRSFFSPNLGQKGVLGDGMEYWRGYHQSIRPTQMGLSLNIDISARSFYEAILVTDFVSKHFDFNMSRPLSDEDRMKVRKALKGVKVEVTHGDYTRYYRITGLSKDPLSSLTFTLDDKKTKKSVVRYFRENYNITLQYLALPALQAGSESKPVYLPMELCQIAAGQRYTRKLNERQVTALLRATCQRPQDRENYIKQMIRHNNFNRDKIVHEFGIQVREELAVVNARVLPAPKLRYHDTGKERWVDPWMGQWNMMNKKMIDGSKVLYWTCVNFSARVNKDLPFQFCSELVSMCNSKGMVFNRDPLLPISSARPTQIEKALVDIHKHSTAELARMNNRQAQLQLLIVILPDASGSYGKIKKICETKLGIVSQCCLPKNASKMSKQYLENVALKINVKAGGRNTALNDAVQKNIPHVSDRPTIIFGADVTHPQPGEDTSPSIAAVVASMDWPWVTNYRGIVSAQPHREEIIQDLYKTVHDPKKGTVHGGMIRELLIAFYRSTRFKPDRIIFYRDGVSEGQFSQVLLHEMEAIRKACGSLEVGYLPRVTFVVVQKRHHTRLFPVDHQSRDQIDKSGNIQPGTVVDTSICHPREYDFYLNSHAGIQGTSRPTHYHVLYDENKFKADELQTLTNNLCYTYARCTRSVSIVPPAYYAHLAAFRARYYVEGETSEKGSAVGSRSTRVEVILPLVKENVKEVMFYC